MPSEQYLQAREKIKQAKQEVQQIAKQLFIDEATALLDELKVDNFSWTQYTPYFNDGDACVFRVYSDYPEVDGLEEDDMPGRPITNVYDEAWRQARREWYDTLPQSKVKNFLSQWEEEDMLFMFGDHAQVVVSRDGVEITEYDHD